MLDPLLWLILFTGRPIYVRLKGQAKERYMELQSKGDKPSQTTLASLKRMEAILQKNPQHGDPLRKEIIPNMFRQQGIKLLYRAELSNYWRITYTIEGTEHEIYVFILSIVNHKEYDKLFGYK